jgi:5'-nucleotidase
MTPIKSHEKIALFDLDGTLCDYEKSLIGMLNAIISPHEGRFCAVPRDDAPQYLRTRMNLIRASAEWWANLPRFKLGFDIWGYIGSLGFRRMVLTAGPKRNANAWAGKKLWIDKNLGIDTEVTITRDKGLVYGKILVDDWPDYIKRWLEWRPRGLVIMPASNSNCDFAHPQVVRYTGRNLNAVKRAIREMV